MQSGCRWVYTLMDWDTGEVVAKGTSVELVEQGYFPDVNKLSSVWNNLEKCKNPSPKNYRWKMERKSTKDDRVERARAEGLSADERAETRMVRVYSCYGADGTLLGKGTAAELKEKGLFGSEGPVHECYRKRGGVYKPGGLHESPKREGNGWERLEPQCYVILRRREAAYQTAKPRT